MRFVVGSTLGIRLIRPCWRDYLFLFRLLFVKGTNTSRAYQNFSRVFSQQFIAQRWPVNKYFLYKFKWDLHANRLQTCWIGWCQRTISDILWMRRCSRMQSNEFILADNYVTISETLKTIFVINCVATHSRLTQICATIILFCTFVAVAHPIYA